MKHLFSIAPTVTPTVVRERSLGLATFWLHEWRRDALALACRTADHKRVAEEG